MLGDINKYLYIFIYIIYRKKNLTLFIFLFFFYIRYNALLKYVQGIPLAHTLQDNCFTCATPTGGMGGVGWGSARLGQTDSRYECAK